MTIREKINYLEALQDVIDYIDSQINYSMTIKRDENNEFMLDENGEFIREVPTEKSFYDFKRYHAMSKLKKEIEKLADK